MKKVSRLISALVFGAAPLLALAQGTTLPPQAGVSSVQDILDLVDRVINILGGLFFAVAVVFIFYAAYLYLTAAGNEEQVGKAKNQLIYAVIAVAVGLVAYSVTAIVQNFLG